MYAPKSDMTYSNSPEDNEEGGGMLSPSFFNRVGSLGDAKMGGDMMSPPLMMSNGGLKSVNPVQQQQAGGQNEDKIVSSVTCNNKMNSSKASPLFQQAGGGGGEQTSAAPFASLAAAAPSSAGSTLSNIISSHKSSNNQQEQHQGYGQLQGQYGYENQDPPEHLDTGGFINTTAATATASGLGTANSKRSTSVLPSSNNNNNNVRENGHDVSTSTYNGANNHQEDDDDSGRRQYEEIMSTPALSSNGHHHKEEPHMSIGGGGEDHQDNNHQQWANNSSSGTTTSNPVPVVAASSSVRQQQSPPSQNEGGADDDNTAPPIIPSSSIWNSNNKDGILPMVFHGKGSFPLNLALMLESVEHPWPYDNDAVSIRGSEGGKMNHIVSWLPCGSGFVIHQPDLFLSEVLPRFFKSSQNTKLRSFYRKLNRWGFSVLRSSQLNQEGTISSVKNAWQHPDFSRQRAVECLVRARKTGDVDYSQMMSVTHVSFGEGGGNGVGGKKGKKRGSKRFSDYSIDSTVDMDDTMDEFNSSFPALDSNFSNKRRGSHQNAPQRMSWTAGVPTPSFQIGGGARIDAATTQSWTAGSNPAPNAAVSAQQLFQLNQSWTAGSNPFSTSTQLGNFETSDFATNNTSQLPHDQFNQLMMNIQSSNCATTNLNNSSGYNEWKDMVMQSNEHPGGSMFGQEPQRRQTWDDVSNLLQVTSYEPIRNNGNSYRSSDPMINSNSQEQQQQQQWQSLHQIQLGQINGSQQQQQQLQPQGNINIEGYSQQGQGEELTQEDEDLRSFFERFAERIGNDDNK